MPLGTHHDVTGMLYQSGRGLELHVDGGGVWALDAPGRARKLVGQRVRVKGLRTGFDLLDVRGIEDAGSLDV
jgi:hypothetical protein